MSNPEPDELLPIGAFSLRCGLSIAALRRYDEAGVLRPVRVDPYSGYRYYAAAQVRSGHLIRLLRSLDVPVATISDLLVAPSPDDALARLDEHWRSTRSSPTRRRSRRSARLPGEIAHDDERLEVAWLLHDE